MPKLSKKKVTQVKSFFENPSKTGRLLRMLKNKANEDPKVILGRDLAGFPVVFRARVAGKERAVKIASDQNVARWVSDSIREAYSSAVKRGKIVPKNYSLKVIKFLGEGKHGGVMPIIKTVSFQDLSNYFVAKEQSPKTKAFLKKHPWVTLDLLYAAHKELRVHLWELSLKGKIPSFDTENARNLFILGASDKQKKIIFGLIDQAHPYQMDIISKRYYSEKK